MEGNQKTKFICKFCNRSFSCGKSLGGHIRIHTTHDKNSAQRTPEEEINRGNAGKFQSFGELWKNKRDSISISVPEAADANSSYKLRENPKKTRRFAADSNLNANQETRFCREESLEKLQLVMDSHSDTEASISKGLRRSKRINNGNSFSNASSSLLHSCLSDSKIDKEQREAALCLMMLSRDNNNGESSDNNSTDSNRVSDLNGCLVMEYRNDRKLKASDLKFSEKLKNIEYNTSVNESRIEGGDAKLGKDVMGNEDHDQLPLASYKYKLRKRSKKGTYGRKFLENQSKKMINPGSLESSLETKNCSISIPDNDPVESSSGKSIIDQSLSGNLERKSVLSKKITKGHKCPICSKVFRSGQALGGHKRSHFIGGSEGMTMVMNQVSDHENKCVIDLNLPAPMEAEEAGYIGFTAW